MTHTVNARGGKICKQTKIIWPELVSEQPILTTP